MFSTLHQLYISGHKWILMLLLVSVDYNKQPNSNFFSFQVHFKSIRGIIWRSKQLLIRIFTLHNVVPNLCQIWYAYVQYLRCCDHFHACLFLDIQRARVLLNFLVSIRTLSLRCDACIHCETIMIVTMITAITIVIMLWCREWTASAFIQWVPMEWYSIQTLQNFFCSSSGIRIWIFPDKFRWKPVHKLSQSFHFLVDVWPKFQV